MDPTFNSTPLFGELHAMLHNRIDMPAITDNVRDEIRRCNPSSHRERSQRRSTSPCRRSLDYGTVLCDDTSIAKISMARLERIGSPDAKHSKINALFQCCFGHDF
jgi:hypothetical protein